MSYGGDSNETLAGARDADQRSGGRGDDIFHIGDTRHLVIEAEGEGNDVVFASVSFNPQGVRVAPL